MLVRVSEYRDAIDHLFRVINVDFHACVGQKERANWYDIARRVYAKVSVLECRRATVDDRQRHARCLDAAQNRLCAYLQSYS